MLPWLLPDSPFPPTEQALDDPNGLLAAGGGLSPDRLIDAYRRGIFPWYNGDDGDPILWWTPSPRCISTPEQLHISRSLRRHIAANPLYVTLDQHFDTVMALCAAPRRAHEGTWISDDMRCAYQQLHTLNVAHSIEIWHGPPENNDLAGALYGLQLGQVFFGESMASPHSNGSKTALAVIKMLARRLGIALIDGQVSSPHLHRMGFELCPRQEFEQALSALIPGHTIDMPRPPWPRFALPVRDLISTF